MFFTRTLVIKAKPHQCSKLIRLFCTSKRLHNYDRAIDIDQLLCPPGRSKALDTVQTRVSFAKTSHTILTEGRANTEDTIIAPEVQTDRTRARDTIAIKPMMPAQPACLPETHDLKTDILSRDSRWSILPARAHSATMAALRSRIVPGVSFFPPGVNSFRSSDNQPPLETSKPCIKRQAIVLNCKTVGVGPGGSESALGRVSAIDFLTGELLIDKLVQPPRIVTHWRTKRSGITAAAMQAARDSGEVLENAAAVREILSRHMDEETVLVSHRRNNALVVLGIQHEKVVSSASLVKTTLGPSVGTIVGLKKLCKEVLGITLRGGKMGYDSVEEALAAREVVLWCMGDPEVVRVWCEKKEKELEAKKLEAKKEEELKAKKVEAKEVAGELEARELSAKRKIELGVARTTELAAKLKVLDAKDSNAAAREMQLAAREVSQEIGRSRSLLERRRVLETEVDSLLRPSEQAERSSSKPRIVKVPQAVRSTQKRDRGGMAHRSLQGSKWWQSMAHQSHQGSKWWQSPSYQSARSAVERNLFRKYN